MTVQWLYSVSFVWANKITTRVDHSKVNLLWSTATISGLELHSHHFLVLIEFRTVIQPYELFPSIQLLSPPQTKFHETAVTLLLFPCQRIWLATFLGSTGLCTQEWIISIFFISEKEIPCGQLPPCWLLVCGTNFREDVSFIVTNLTSTTLGSVVN